MPAPSIKETLQSAQQAQAAATKIIQAIQDLERIREQRDGFYGRAVSAQGISG